ncbi:MAG: DNA repair protein RecN [Eubacteriales bacterium]|nr:DNA repair protein RecN [Eubacteriales bacterium]
MLNISNYALIDHLEIEFSSGLNVLSGETGAGKSIIVGAISLLMGGRTQGEYIRNKDQKTWVEGCFDFPLSQELQDMAGEMGISLEEDYLVIRREINPNGKSIARINGVVVQAGFLKVFASKFLNIYGQHDFQILSDPSNHLAILDNAGKVKISSLKKEVREKYAEFDEKKKKAEDLKKKILTEEQKKDFLAFQYEELEKIDIKGPEEDAEIDQELLILENQEKISQLTYKASENLYGQGSAYEKIGNALSEISQLSRFIEKVKETEERLNNIYFELEDIVLEIKNYIKEEEFDQKKLDLLSERKFNLQRIKKKYNLDLKGLLDKKEEIAQELEILSNTAFYLEQAERELEIAFNLYSEKAEELSSLRKEVAKELEENIKKELAWLGMNNVVFKTLFEKVNPGTNGTDSVEFLISANLGEEPKGIAKIASGGEMSRIMLSLKVIITEDGISSMIFDEVDSGIGGETILKVAEKLLQVSREKQVLCVTHSPQMAAVAKSHFLISKIEKNNRTETKVEALGDEERITEISRMLGDRSEAGRKFAEKLLNT